MEIRQESLKKHYEWKGKIEVVSRAPINSREDLSFASLIPNDEISEENIIAPALDKRVAQVVAEAVIKVARETGVARI